ncbi:thioredoxin [Flavobacterium subsaxonicum]|uniref:Thioredoxin n=1 Tax=Flavobacterium subsaxonicum WB 4.1-42 = DSM 21790 TaxID=1121898 RepID=A0A0A2MTR9_9FLAO|nr:thioredoxin [Flavobacterium subsaxonicum]KGO95006.1 thioredoxin [Flavobacterium subsaxonicum WB 4.1-42 = DSM 21790]
MEKFSQLISSNEPVLIDFFATWCGPCQTMAPILKDVKDELGESIKIIKVDVDKNQALMASPQFQVRGVPTLMLFQNGKMLWKQAGLMTKNEIVSKIKSAV